MNLELEKAMMLHKQGRIQQAEEGYQRALLEDFNNVQTLYLLGTIYYQLKRFGLAAQLLIRASQLKPDFFEVWNNLGNCYKAINNDEKSKECWEKALNVTGRQNGEYADIWNNLATIHINSGDPEKGIEPVKKSLELKRDHPDANWNLSLLNLEMGKFGEGFDKYEWGFKTKNRLFRNYGDNVRIWTGKQHKTIVVWGEQGIGDEILFASMIQDLRRISGKVIFDCHPRLVNIFKESFPGVDVHGTRKDEYIGWDSTKADFKVAIGDLGKYFRRKLEDFPKHEGYLKANSERVEHYKKRLDKISNKLKVGISWTGGYIKTRKDFRSIELEKWLPILRQDAEFISLQYTPDAYNTVAEIEDKYDVRIHHWPSAVQNSDYAETAALISALDLVITVNTSVHHLAGALGKKCWTLTPVGKAWRYWSPDGHSIPWYPSVYQYQSGGDWDPIINQVAEDLKNLITENREKANEHQLCNNG